MVLASVEFGPDGYRSSRLISVLGHGRCGAGTAATSAIQTGQRAPGHIQAVVDALRPAYHVAVGQPGDLVNNMIRAQTKLTVPRLRKDPRPRRLILSDGLASGDWRAPGTFSRRHRRTRALSPPGTGGRSRG